MVTKLKKASRKAGHISIDGDNSKEKSKMVTSSKEYESRLNCDGSSPLQNQSVERHGASPRSIQKISSVEVSPWSTSQKQIRPIIPTVDSYRNEELTVTKPAAGLTGSTRKNPMRAGPAVDSCLSLRSSEEFRNTCSNSCTIKNRGAIPSKPITTGRLKESQEQQMPTMSASKSPGSSPTGRQYEDRADDVVESLLALQGSRPSFTKDSSEASEDYRSFHQPPGRNYGGSDDVGRDQGQPKVSNGRFVNSGFDSAGASSGVGPVLWKRESDYEAAYVPDYPHKAALLSTSFSNDGEQVPGGSSFEYENAQQLFMHPTFGLCSRVTDPSSFQSRLPFHTSGADSHSSLPLAHHAHFPFAPSRALHTALGGMRPYHSYSQAMEDALYSSSFSEDITPYMAMRQNFPIDRAYYLPNTVPHQLYETHGPGTTETGRRSAVRLSPDLFSNANAAPVSDSIIALYKSNGGVGHNGVPGSRVDTSCNDTTVSHSTAGDLVHAAKDIRCEEEQALPISSATEINESARRHCDKGTTASKKRLTKKESETRVSKKAKKICDATVVIRDENRNDNNSDMDDELDDASCSYTPDQQSRWDEMFGRLVHFKKSHGHTRVPENYDDAKLANWVGNQRRAMSRQQRGLPFRRFDEKRIHLLDSIGFEWARARATKPGQYDRRSWDEMFQSLIKFKEIHGHTRVPSNHDVRLANWVSNQRTAMSRKQRGLPFRCLNDHKIKLLDSIGFAWVCQGAHKSSHQDHETSGATKCIQV